MEVRLSAFVIQEGCGTNCYSGFLKRLLELDIQEGCGFKDPLYYITL